ncbi:hypothetical protein CE91St1_26930 [Parabacteroides goldsteinii]|nr:hypothetical protein CE91St1_26930 [Parabacteroides goldsteinii]GKG79485.1 hypothetical protein CE91St2_26770 [Parabacteroides goldsteinii]
MPGTDIAAHKQNIGHIVSYQPNNPVPGKNQWLHYYNALYMYGIRYKDDDPTPTPVHSGLSPDYDTTCILENNL